MNSTLKSSTALLVAAAFGSETVIDLLLAKKDVNVNARNMQGETALWHAVYAGRMCAVTRLLQRQNLDIDVADTLHKMTPFALAVSYGHLDIAKTLLDSDKVDINVRDNRGRTPLRHAVISEREESIILLLSSRRSTSICGTSITARRSDMPFDCGNLDAAQLLIMHGPNPNTPSSHWITPLHKAIRGRNIAMVSLLLDRNNLELSLYYGWADLSQPPVIAAVCVGDIRVLGMLLRRGARVNIFNNHGY
jgi:ankyrin repeat protein